MMGAHVCGFFERATRPRYILDTWIFINFRRAFPFSQPCEGGRGVGVVWCCNVAGGRGCGGIDKGAGREGLTYGKGKTIYKQCTDNRDE